MSRTKGFFFFVFVSKKKRTHNNASLGGAERNVLKYKIPLVIVYFKEKFYKMNLSLSVLSHPMKKRAEGAEFAQIKKKKKAMHPKELGLIRKQL